MTEPRVPVDGRAQGSDRRVSPAYPMALKGAEVAAALGISRSLAYEWMANGTLPVIRIGKVLRVPRAALEEWLRVQTHPARRVG